MAKGGARSRSGPPPDPNSLTFNDGEWETLPASGRPGEPPTWPLTSASGRELTLWSELWVKPQAVMWERQRLEHTVALYVRRLTEAEEPGSPAAISTLVKQLGEGLGLTPPGLRSLRWKIAATDESAAKSEPRTGPPSARERLQLVPGG